jgi:hypothetical protein
MANFDIEAIDRSERLAEVGVRIPSQDAMNEAVMPDTLQSFSAAAFIIAQSQPALNRWLPL